MHDPLRAYYGSTLPRLVVQGHGFEAPFRDWPQMRKVEPERLFFKRGHDDNVIVVYRTRGNVRERCELR